MEKLLSQLVKNKGDIDVNEIMSFCEDILIYLDDDDDEFEMNQQFVGMQELFRGYVVSDWKGTNMKCKKYRYLNEIIARESVFFYNKCWKHRNEVQHDPVKQKERMVKWYEKEKERGKKSEYRQIRLYVEKSKLDANACNSDTIKRWIMNLKRIEKKVEKIPATDIRRFMIV